jgi:hypothetical protein
MLIQDSERLGARLWARPKRIAFLVDDSFGAGDLNNVVRYCSRYLGGRANAIVPVDNGTLGSGWRDVLRAVDPDILYSFKPLDDKLKQELERLYRPSRFIEAHPTQLHDDGWKISESEIGGTPLTDVNLAYQADFYGTPSVVQITLDDMERGTDDAFNFCVRNFGAFSERDWKSFALGAKGLKIQPIASIGEPVDFLGEMLPSAGKIFPINVSSVGYERSPLVWSAGDEAQVYEIVIGDSVRDFLYVWNRSITTNFNWRKRALWVPGSLVSSERMITACASWVRDCVFHEGQVECRVLSYSASETELEVFQEKLQPQIHRRTSYAVLKPDEACAISTRSIWRCAAKGTRFEFGASDRVYGAPYPESLPSGKHGPQGWIVEIEFDSAKDGLGAAFKASDWHLPKRHRLDKKFISNQQDSRITALGHLAVEVTGEKRDFAIKVPTIKDLCDGLLVEVRSVRSNGTEQMKTGEFRRIDTSSDGQYLWSILNLFGGLDRASNFLEDKGWRDVLFHLIGERSLEEDIDGLLSDFIQRQQGSKSTDSHGKSKAKRELVKALVSMPAESRYVHFHHMVKLLTEGGSMLTGGGLEPIRRQLHVYLSRSMFIQGSAVRCYNCGSQRWYRADDLKTTMTCQGCAGDFSLPPIESMTYRLNDLVLNGFRRYGFLPVFQALFSLQRSARKHLLFLPQQNLYDWTSDEQVTDLDLIGILDGRYFIGEVKTGYKGLLSIDTDELARISLELRPDLLLIAAPSAAFTKKVETHLTPLFEKLKDTGIKSHAMPLSWPDVAIPLALVSPGTDEED